MPPESYNIAKILGNEVCLKILGTCTSFRQWMGGKSGKLPSRFFFQCRYFAPMSPLGAHTYLSWWRQPNSQIQIPICTEKKKTTSTPASSFACWSYPTQRQGEITGVTSEDEICSRPLLWLGGVSCWTLKVRDCCVNISVWPFLQLICHPRSKELIKTKSNQTTTFPIF